MRILNPEQEERIERLEAEILQTITYIDRVDSVRRHLDHREAEYLAKLRNLIAAYRSHRTQPEVDDLMFAIIRDDQLTLEQVQIVFSYSDQGMADAIGRMRERDRYGY